MHLNKPEIGFEEPPRPRAGEPLIQELGAGMIRVAEQASNVKHLGEKLTPGQRDETEVHLDIVFGISGFNDAQLEEAMIYRHNARIEVLKEHSENMQRIFSEHAAVANPDGKAYEPVGPAEHPFEFPDLVKKKNEFAAEKRKNGLLAESESAKLFPKAEFEAENRRLQVKMAAVNIGLPADIDEEVLFGTLEARLDGYDNVQKQKVFRILEIEFLLPADNSDK